VAVNVALFALEAWWGASQWSPTLYRMGALAGREALAGEPWRVLSSAFLHIGLTHLLLNMWALYSFGQFLEALLGPWRLLVLYAAAAAGGGVASSLAHEQRLAAGASGAVWGLMVAELVLLLWPRVLFDDVVFNVSRSAVLQPLALNLFISLLPGIDLVAHLGGGVAGGLIMATGVLARDARDRLWRPAAVAAAALMAAGIAAAFAHGRPWELRRPVLEMRALPGTEVAVPVPRGLEMTAQGEAFVFGSLRRDPLVVGCRVTASQHPSPAPDPAQGTFVTPQGVRVHTWSLSQGGTVLRLEVVHDEDAPAPWPAVPERIARGVVFRSPAPNATAPAPSAPGPRPSPPPAAAPSSR
jgi:membrane associated rhomboid family serine protease